MNIFLKVFFFRWLPLMLLIYVLSAIGSYWCLKLVPVALMFFLCRWDIIGYFQITERGRFEDGKFKTDEAAPEVLAAYRFQATETNIAILALSFFLVDAYHPWADAAFSVLGFYIAFAFGFKDILYYLGLKDKKGLADYVIEDDGITVRKNLWSWMYWTPAGILEFISSKKYTELSWLKYFKGVFIDHTIKNYVWVRVIKIQAAIGFALAAALIIFIW